MRAMTAAGRELEAELARVRATIAKFQGQAIGEENTKHALIEPVLRALGWHVEDLDEVRCEYKLNQTDNPVDYALFVDGKLRLFVEAKALGENLADQRWANQIMGYAAVAGVVEWIVLTDGNEYRVYNAHAKVHVDQKLFRHVVVASGEPIALDTLALLSKVQLREATIKVICAPRVRGPPGEAGRARARRTGSPDRLCALAAQAGSGRRARRPAREPRPGAPLARLLADPATAATRQSAVRARRLGVGFTIARRRADRTGESGGSDRLRCDPPAPRHRGSVQRPHARRSDRVRCGRGVEWDALQLALDRWRDGSQIDHRGTQGPGVPADRRLDVLARARRQQTPRPARGSPP